MQMGRKQKDVLELAGELLPKAFKKAFRYFGNHTCIQDTSTGLDSSQHKVVAHNIKRARIKSLPPFT